MFNTGILFLFSESLPLKPFSEKNKHKYKDKLLLHKFTLLNELNTDTKTSGFRIHQTDTKITMKMIPKLLNDEYTLNKTDIIEFNPIHKKKITKFVDPQLNTNYTNNNLSIFVIILNSRNKTSIIDKLNTIKSPNKYMPYDKLLIYNLDTMTSDDIPTTLINYDNLNISSKQSIILDNINKQIKLDFYRDILESLMGLITFDNETKRYI